MQLLQVIGLFAGIAILIIGAYRGVGALPITVLAGFVVVITNGMPIWESFSGDYMDGYISFLKSYFPIFASSALYSKLMEESGSAVAVGYKLIDWFGKNQVMLVCFVATCLLTYGGISLFVAIFAMAPIMILLFKEADLPKRLTMAPFIAGSCTLTCTALPGTPSITNVIPANYFGTGLTAAPVLSIISSAMLFGFCFAYMKWEEHRCRVRGEHFSFGPGDDPAKYNVDRSELPPAWKAFCPLLSLILIIIIGGRFVSDSNMLVVVAMLIASVMVLVFNWGRLGNKKVIINNGLAGAITAIAGPCAVVAFGTLVKATPAFQTILTWLLGLEMNPYLTGILSVSVISGVTGSSSGGMTITLDSVGPYLMASGCNLSILHRLMSLAAGTLDSLPHASGYFLMFGHMGLTHKDSYKYAGITSVVIPIIVLLILTPIIILLGL